MTEIATDPATNTSAGTVSTAEREEQLRKAHVLADLLRAWPAYSQSRAERTVVLLDDEAARLLGLLAEKDATIQRVRDLHEREKHGTRWYCAECVEDDGTGSWRHVAWPCPTSTALDGQEGR